MPTLINPFEVPPGADEAFVAGWRRARDFLASREGFSATTLHRALRPDAEFRFVHDDGTPDGTEGVILINAFEVPDGEDEPFLAGWERAREALASERGYLGTRLHRSAGPAAFR